MTQAQILKLIDAASEPDEMSKRDALDFLESLVTELDCRIGALRDEIRVEESGDD